MWRPRALRSCLAAVAKTDYFAADRPRLVRGRMVMRKLLPVFTLLTVGLALALAHAQQIHRNDFGNQVQWLKGSGNANFREIEHKTTDEYAHKGATSETITIEAELGPNSAAPFVHYLYPTPQAPISPQLSCSVWVRAEQPGIQLRARVVLPRVENRQRPGEMFTTFLDADSYKLN